MGIIARIVGDESPDSNVLGLSSRYRLPADVRRERDREVGRSMARAQVVVTDIRGLESAGTVAIVAMSNVNNVAEHAAARLPEERARVDSIADAVAIGLNRKVSELADGMRQ